MGFDIDWGGAILAAVIGIIIIIAIIVVRVRRD